MNLAFFMHKRKIQLLSLCRNMASGLFLFFTFFGQVALAQNYPIINLEGLPYTIRYGDPITLKSWVVQPCGPYFVPCNVVLANPLFINKTNGATFSSNPRNLYVDTFIRTFTAGISEEGKTFLPLGQSTIASSYQGHEAVYTVNVLPRITTTSILATVNSVQVGELLDLTVVSRGFLAKGATSGQLTDPLGNISQAPPQYWNTESSTMQFGLRLTQFRPGTYRFVANFTSSVASNTDSTSDVFVFTVQPAKTTNTLTISRTAPIPLGSPFTLSSTIGSGIGAASGTVEFFDGDVSLGRAFVQNSQASLTTLLGKNAGAHILRAKYSGDEFNASSTSADASMVFSPAVTTATVGSSQNPGVWGKPVTWEARVAGQQPQGNVSFFDGTILLDKRPLVTGLATLSNWVLPQAGDHLISAVYEGDANNLASSSVSFRQTVLKADTSNALSISNPAPYTVGKALAITAQFIDAGPTGTVNFYDGTVLLGSGNIVGNSAVLTTPPLATLGTHLLHAEYAGDANNNGSTSANLSINVERARTVNTLTSSSGNVQFGKPVTLSARLDGANPGGQMGFYDGENLLGTSSINAGNASLSVATLTAGEHGLSARYAGDELNLASTSPVLTQVISKADTVNTLSSGNPSPMTPASSLTFVADLGTSASARTGTVSFYDGAALLGSATLQDNKAILNEIRLTGLGQHQIRAQYSGDVNFNGSASNNLSVNIEVVNTVSTLSSSANPVFSNTAVTFTLQVAGAAPAGTATFFADGKLLGMAAVTDGRATLSTKFNRPGRPVITASYSGDAGNQPGTAAPFTQTVKFNAALLLPILQMLGN